VGSAGFEDGNGEAETEAAGAASDGDALAREGEEVERRQRGGGLNGGFCGSSVWVGSILSAYGG
jgi:hypothetical protein